MPKPVFWVRIAIFADPGPDTDVYLNATPDLFPDPGLAIILEATVLLIFFPFFQKSTVSFYRINFLTVFFTYELFCQFYGVRSNTELDPGELNQCGSGYKILAKTLKYGIC